MPVPHVLTDDLARPGAFPPPRPRSVTFESTHASWVFLTETEAWKVKRPVDYGFLDYSDAAKRLRCCEEEVRLGCRLAPGVYLGVAPVYEGAGAFSFAGPGSIVDHAVRMRRLAEPDSARSLVRAGRFDPSRVGQLAAVLAAFYADAPLTPELGAPGVLAHNVEENFRQTAGHAGRFVAAETLEALRRWQREALGRAEPRLLERIAEGRIRDGHGDLRLEHVYFTAGTAQPLVIDPIEFNRRLRCQDVALDASFLAMELALEGRPDLAAFFLYRFARDTNDYAFYPLLDLYLSYRACVRAKVACFVAADPSTPPEKAARKAAEAADLFTLATSYTRASPPGERVIAVGGTIGAGKSTLAEALALALELPVVSSDATRKALAHLPVTARGGPELYTSAYDRRTMDAMLRSAGSVLESGHGVVLDATFREAGARARARDLARRHGRPFVFVEVECDEETIRARLRRRRGEASVSDAGEELLDAIRFQRPLELDPAERVVVDGRVAPDESARRLIRDWRPAG